MSQPTVYLAGPISGLTYDQGTSWRDYATLRLRAKGVRCASPLRSKEFLKAEGVISPKAYAVSPLSSQRGIMTRDRFDVMNSTMVLMNLLGATQVSQGSVMEAGWADAFRKPLVICMEADNIHQHPMILDAAGYVVDDLDLGIAIVASVLLPYVEEWK